MPLAEDDSLFQFSFLAGKARLQIKRQADGVVGWIEDHVTILDGDAREFELRAVRWRAFAEITEALGGSVQIQRDAVVVRHAVFQFLAQFPPVEVLPPDSPASGALRAQGDPLFELQLPLRCGSGFVGVSKAAFIRPRCAQAEAAH